MANDPKEYKKVDDTFLNPKHREKGLPIDEARKAFKGHETRLRNLDRSNLSDDEKMLLDIRQKAIKTANKLYQEKQAKALGIDITQNQNKNNILMEEYNNLSAAKKRKINKQLVKVYKSLTPEQKKKLPDNAKKLGEELVRQEQKKLRVKNKNSNNQGLEKRNIPPIKGGFNAYGHRLLSLYRVIILTKRRD